MSKCKHGRELYKDNRICRECMGEREDELLKALEVVRDMIKKETDRASMVKYLDGVIDDVPPERKPA